MNIQKLNEISTEGFQLIQKLRQNPYTGPIMDELARYEAFYTGLIPFFDAEYKRKNQINGATDLEKLYTILKSYYSKLEFKKAIHFADHRQTKEPYLFVLNFVITGSLRNLAAFLDLYTSYKTDFTEGYKKIWIDSYDDTLKYVLRDLTTNTPCREAYNRTLENTILELQSGPPEKEEEKSNIQILMKPEQFKSDGGFRLAVKPIYKDYQLIGLSLAAFKAALCTGIDNCKEGDEGKEVEIQQAYNVNNYKIFLSVIEFYNNDSYGTKMFPNFESVVSFIDTMGLSLPEPKEWLPPQCCQATLKHELREYEGGGRRYKRKTKRKTKRSKRTRKQGKTKKRALTFLNKYN